MKARKTKYTHKEIHPVGCDHQSFSRRFVMGEPTQDYICVQCGMPMSQLSPVQLIKH